MKAAIVHDWLNQMGGAEVVLEALVEIYPRPQFQYPTRGLGLPKSC